MSYEDRSLTCVECGQSFIFTADDQSYHAEKGYTNEPKRCTSCRQSSTGPAFLRRFRRLQSGPTGDAFRGLRRMWQGCHRAV